jgi:hypothetical protein
VRDTLFKEGRRPYTTSPHGLATAKGLVTAEAIAERVRRYILDGSDEDLRRLLGVAEIAGEQARSAFRRVGMQEGWHAIDCGCGVGARPTAAMAMYEPHRQPICSARATMMPAGPRR